MPATFVGSTNSGKDGGVSMTWALAALAADPVGVLGILGVPLNGFTDVLWTSFIVDPTSIQQSYTFGTAKVMQLALTRTAAYFVDATHCFLPGRVVIFVPSTGQTFVYAPSKYNIASIQNYNPGVAFESVDDSSSIVLPESAKLKVFMEADLLNQTTVLTPQTQLVITLFNFKIASGKV